MPAILCTCGERLSYGEIPSPNEWHLISDVDFDNFSGQVNAEEVYMATKGALRCPKCDRIWIFWDGFQRAPTEYTPASSGSP